MLTAKIGETIINSFDNEYDRYILKQWSNKNIIKCPVCNGTYEYCHGEVVSPYFRHKEKDCDGYYSEPETEEHKQGKILLYNWIKSQVGVSNCQLEHWIPVTKQRPDIYFEYNGKHFVIEYQCTPIASEFILRRELYKLAGIHDIWILGIEKYNIEKNKDNYRVIERELLPSGLLYFSSTSEEFIIHKSFISNSLNINYVKKTFYPVSIGELLINNDKLTLSNKIATKFVYEDKKLHEVREMRIEKEKEKAYRENFNKRLSDELLRKKIRFNEYFSNYVDKEILLIHQGRQEVPNGIRFKILKGFNISDEYMENIFKQELEFLNKKNLDKFIFMLPKYHSYFNNYGFSRYIKVLEFNDIIKKHFKSFGFNNVKFINESEEFND